MSLKSFHIFFIFVSALLCAWMLGWALMHRNDPNAPLMLVCGAAGGGALLAYLRWFLGQFRSSRLLALGLALGLLSLPGAPLMACAVCFASEEKTVSAFNWGIVFLAAVTFLTLGGITAMMLRAIRQREDASD